MLVALSLAIGSLAYAENSAVTWTGKDVNEQGIFTSNYNNYGATIGSNKVVVIDTSATADTTLGAYITMNTTTGSVYTLGVTDKAISSGRVGPVCVRGPHQVYVTGAVTVGDIVGNANVTESPGWATSYTHTAGTAQRSLGVALQSCSSNTLCWIDIKVSDEK
jgi:hypothetical protein